MSVNREAPSRSDFQTNRKRFTGARATVRFFLGQISKRVAAVIDTFSRIGARAFRDVFLYIRITAFLLWSEIAIGLAFFDQLSRGGAVLVRVVGLKYLLFVIIQPQPRQASRMPVTMSADERSTSVSSMRSRNVPP
jgi:hypothetical protein